MDREVEAQQVNRARCKEAKQGENRDRNRRKSRREEEIASECKGLKVRRNYRESGILAM